MHYGIGTHVLQYLQTRRLPREIEIGNHVDPGGLRTPQLPGFDEATVLSNDANLRSFLGDDFQSTFDRESAEQPDLVPGIFGELLENLERVFVEAPALVSAYTKSSLGSGIVQFHTSLRHRFHNLKVASPQRALEVDKNETLVAVLVTR